MKHILVSFLAVFFVFASCDIGTNNTGKSSGTSEDSDTTEVSDPNKDPVVEPVDPEEPVNPLVEEIENDSRLVAFGAKSVKWLRRPLVNKSISYDLIENDPIAEYCTEPGWSYIFYDDQAVIGYEPFPERVDIMQSAVKITVELNNRDHPNKKWNYINVPIIINEPITSNDPTLGKWQYALCNDSGAIVDGPYTAEFDWEWQLWKERVAAIQRDSYNINNDPDAHIVWGTDE